MLGLAAWLISKAPGYIFHFTCAMLRRNVAFKFVSCARYKLIPRARYKFEGNIAAKHRASEVENISGSFAYQPGR